MITQLDRVGLIVNDADRSAEFYAGRLGMERVTRRIIGEVNPTVGRVFDLPGAVLEKQVRLAKGAFYLVLFEFRAKGRPRARARNNPGVLTLGVVNDRSEEESQRLRGYAPAAFTSRRSAAGVTFAYNQDPDGGVAGFVGNAPAEVDAVATVTVEEAAATARFYRNFGMVRLPALDEAEAGLQAIGMRLGRVGFQFVEYLSEKGGERGGGMNDAGAVQFDFFSDDVEGDYERVRASGGRVISPPVKTKRGTAGTGFDPNGVMWELSSDDGVHPKSPSYYREHRAPRVAEQDGNEVFIVDGIPLQWSNSMGLMGSAGVPNERLHELKRHQDANPGGWEPHKRVADMHADGVDAEVLYCSLSMPLHQVREAAYQAACFRAYNDWLAEFCAAYPERLIGVALIPLLDLETGVLELNRVAKKGLKGAAISLDLAAATGRPYWSPTYDPFWAQASALEMPVSLHSLTGTSASTKGKFARYSTAPAAVQETVANLIEFGVLERFPKLRVISVENDAGWVPNYAARLDHVYTRNRHYKNMPSPLKMLPSEYLRRQLRLTFMYDKVAVEQRGKIGVETLLWASDYPHGDSTWPKSKEFIEWQFGDVPAEERQRMVRDNVAELYGIRQTLRV